MNSYRILRRVVNTDKLSRFANNKAFTAACKRYSIAAPSVDTLPLAGIRVLDMTRVLAGVSYVFYLSLSSNMLNCCLV